MLSDHQLLADIVLKFLPFDKLFRPDEQNEGAVGRSQHTVDLVDADVPQGFVLEKKPRERYIAK